MQIVTVIIPCYNEAERIDTDAVSKYLEENDHVSFIFVDDGSSDDTGKVIRRLCRRNRFCTGIYLAKNRGKGEAVRIGLMAAMQTGSRYVGYWDADMATPLPEIARFVKHLEKHPGCKVVMAARVKLLGRKVHRKLARHLVGRAFATAASMALRLPVYDTQCGAKLFRVTDVLGKSIQQRFKSRWVFDVELMARLMRRGYGEHDFFEIPVARWDDVDDSKVKIRDFFFSFYHLVRVYFYLRPRRVSGRQNTGVTAPSDFHPAKIQ